MNKMPGRHLIEPQWNILRKKQLNSTWWPIRSDPPCYCCRAQRGQRTTNPGRPGGRFFLALETKLFFGGGGGWVFTSGVLDVNPREWWYNQTWKCQESAKLTLGKGGNFHRFCFPEALQVLLMDPRWWKCLRLDRSCIPSRSRERKCRLFDGRKVRARNGRGSKMATPSLVRGKMNKICGF